MNYIAEEILMHYGMPRRSGRYPYGSGENPYQHSGDFLSRVDELRSQGFTFTDENGRVWTGDTAIAKSMNLSTGQFRTQLSLANTERRNLLADTARGLREKGYSLNEIAAKMGFNNDSSIRALLNDEIKDRRKQAQKTADFLKQQVDEKGMIDVGAGVELSLGISKEKLRDALYILELEGYPVYGGGIPQVTNPGKQTNVKVLCPPETEHKEIYNWENVHSLENYISYDSGDSFRRAFIYPESMDSKRLKINYAEDGGIEKDGLIEIRRGVDDLSLGDAHYAQVRILVDGDRFMKGMAVYSDDLPKGVDVVFNTNKERGTDIKDVLKKISDDPDNPFGSLIKEHGGQSFYDDPNGKYTDPITGNKQSLSLINKRAEEGDWHDWEDKLPSQFLAKQSLSLIKKQLNLAKADKIAEYEEICSLTNPVVKKSLLNSFADDCDAAAVHLKAAALPRQKYQVIIPIPKMKDTEVYAPNYKNGEKVALIRYPHAGTFEIPILTVNNKHPDAKKVLGTNPIDAVGINSKVAGILSGADFDGDTVMVIPCNSSNSKVRIVATEPSDISLKNLRKFDPKAEYPERQGMTYMKNEKTKTDNTQIEMGKISNLITDMTLKGATEDELARAVRHSMVVIDAGKHKLDYKRSEEENGIKALKRKYQGVENDDGDYHEGASTLISRAKSQTSIIKRKGSPRINKETGEVTYKETDEIDSRTGKKRTEKSTKMAEAKDAYELISDANTPQERAYADYANSMKALANDARKTMVNTKAPKQSAAAKAIYQNETASLKAKLNNALKNAPRERQAQMIANSAVKAKQLDNPDITKAELKKIRQQELARARVKVGAKRETIDVTDKEWEAIQSGAISSNLLTQIVGHADIDKLKERAMPRETKSLNNAQINRIKAYGNSGYTNEEIAKALGISVSTVIKYIKS